MPKELSPEATALYQFAIIPILPSLVFAFFQWLNHALFLSYISLNYIYFHGIASTMVQFRYTLPAYQKKVSGLLKSSFSLNKSYKS